MSTQQQNNKAEGFFSKHKKTISIVCCIIVLILIIIITVVVLNSGSSSHVNNEEIVSPSNRGESKKDSNVNAYLYDNQMSEAKMSILIVDQMINTISKIDFENDASREYHYKCHIVKNIQNIQTSFDIVDEGNHNNNNIQKRVNLTLASLNTEYIVLLRPGQRISFCMDPHNSNKVIKNLQIEITRIHENITETDTVYEILSLIIE